MIRQAGPEDDGALRALAATPMPGAVSLAFTAEPSFFQAIRVHGEEARVLVAQREGGIHAMGTIATRRVFCNGQPREVGYLACLRIAPEAQRGSILARGYHFFENLHREELGLPFYLTSIMEDNALAAELLTSGRAGLPIYEEAGRYRTMIFSADSLGRPGKIRGVEFRGGDPDTASAAWDLLQEAGPRRQFFPVFHRADWERGETGLPGLGAADFLVASREGVPQGTLALWDQRAFRQVRVMGYSPMMGLAAAASRLLAGILKTPPLPEIGEPLPLAFASFAALRDVAPALFRALLEELLGMAAKRGIAWVGAGFFEGDPLGEAVRPLARWTLSSRIYKVFWKEGSWGSVELDGRPPYLDLGSL